MISFLCQINLLYFIFVGLFSLCSWVYMYMCICHYFNYYLPNFVTTICLGCIFYFSFWGICFILTWCHNQPTVESPFLTRDQTLRLWSGNTDPKVLDYQSTDPIRLLWPWAYPCKNTGVRCHFLLQGIFPTQGLNPGILHWRQML